ncbi:hypothetical protein [Spiroplasma endosymbiont of Nebria brevicollis]|uniref:hypothetical protein n=1 Tax=Spiroplasma endosymbiont of Nebria brevicollis TaxID=3066284 RepID=UPI00313E027C
MAIKDPILFITVEEFKLSKYFNELLFDKVTTPDNEIWFAISVASSNIDYLSGFTISKKWPEITPTDFTDNVQTATTNYVRFLLTKDVDYLRGQGSISQGGLTYSETNPDDPYFIPPEVFNYLRKIKEYPNIKGFNLKGIEPQKNNYFNKFISNCGEDSPLNAYIPYTNIKSLDIRTKITITNTQNMLRPVVNIDTRGINTSTTVPEFKSPKKTINIKYDKETHIVNSDVSDKVIYFDDLDDKKNAIEILKHTLVPNFIYKWVAYKNFNPFTEDYSSYLNGTLIPKKYADDKLLLKQDKLIAGTNITIKDNIISATGGSEPPDLTDYYKKEETNNLLDKKENKLNLVYEGTTELIYHKMPDEGNDLWIPNGGWVKKYVDNKIINKQDKLTAGDNITIDENNKISATGGSSVDENRIFDNKDDKDTTTNLINNVIKKGNITLTYRNNPFVTDDLDIPHKKYVDDKINELNFIKWKSVGTISNENDNIAFNFKLNTLYRVSYSWAYLKSNGSSKYLIFMWRGAPAILDSTFQAENNQKVVTNYVDLGVTSAMIYLKKYNYQTGFLLSLEEAENTNTKNYSEQILPITPPIPPTPCPCPKWKEVGTRQTKDRILYTFIVGKKYRVTYMWYGDTQPISYSITKEFDKLVSNKIDCIYTIDSYVRNWNVVKNRIELFKLEVNNICIRINNAGGITYGNILKLEELQE